MSASLLVRSAARAVRRSTPQGSFRRSPVRMLSGGVGKFGPNEHSQSKPNIGDTQRFKYGNRVCQAAESQKEWDELAAEFRVVQEKMRVLAQSYKEAEKQDTRREKVVVCAVVLFYAWCVYGLESKSAEKQVM